MTTETIPAALAPATSRPLPRGLIARTAIQCVDPETGLTGSWYFSGDSCRAKGARVSPLFADLYDLFRWLVTAPDWEFVGDTSAARYVGNRR